MKPSTYREVHFRGWPGSEHWRPPATPNPFYPRLGDRVSLVLAAASDLGTVPDRFGLGAYLVILGRSVLEAGLLVPDGLDERERWDLDHWASAQTVLTASGPKRWSVLSVSEFFHPYSGRFATRAYTGAGFCIGADLGRVFGLMAEHAIPRKGPNRDSWDLWMPGWGAKGAKGNVHRVSPHRPCLRVGPRRVGWGVSFGPLRRGNGKQVGDSPWRGAFLDVLSLAHALDADRAASFGEHRASVDLDPVELSLAVSVDTDGAEEMMASVAAVHELALALDDRASRWFTSSRDRAEGRGRLDLARTVSPGGIATQVLTRLGVRAPHLTFHLTERESSRWAETFHGGWCEADPRILGVPFPAVALDVASCFPLVAELMGWWDLVRAERVVRRKVIGALRRLCRKAVDDPGVLLDPAVWRRFACCLVLVRPAREILPVEAHDPRRPDGRLEFVPLSSPERPVWLSAFDVLVAAVTSKRVPDILEATAYVPEGIQAGIRSRLPLLPGRAAHKTEGPVLPMVGHRGALKAAGDTVTAGELRVVVNALVFGNPSRMDETWVKEGRTWTRGERPGPHICLPIASSVSAGAHLLVAILDRLVVDRGGMVAYRDTDSSIIPSSPEGGDMALSDGTTVRKLPWGEVDEIIGAFDGLSRGHALWTCVRGEEPSPLHALIFGPKRHGEYMGDTIVDLTESGLGGTYVDPPSMRGRDASGFRRWSLVAVGREMAYAQARISHGEALRPMAPWDNPHDSLPFPALRRFMVKTPEMARLLPRCLGARPGTRYVEASGSVTGRSYGRTIVALDPGGSLSGWRDLYWVDKATGVPVNVTTDPEETEGVLLETLDARAIEWSRAPRSEPIESVVIDPDLTAYWGHVSGVIDADQDGLGDLEARRPLYRSPDRLAAVQRMARRMKYRAFARRTDLPESVAKRAAAGRPISELNVTKALEALRVAEDAGTCALDGCDESLRRPNARYCSPAHAQKARRGRRRELIGQSATDYPRCPVCGTVLLGLAAARGRCRDCKEVGT